jgi:hypothetical protein
MNGFGAPEVSYAFIEGCIGGPDLSESAELVSALEMVTLESYGDVFVEDFCSLSGKFAVALHDRAEGFRSDHFCCVDVWHIVECLVWEMRGEGSREVVEYLQSQLGGKMRLIATLDMVSRDSR